MNNDQTRVTILRKRLGKKWPWPGIFDSWAFLVTEVGEIGDSLLRAGFGSQDSYVRHHEGDENPQKELADAYIMLCTLASHLYVDLSEALVARLKEIEERTDGPT